MSALRVAVQARLSTTLSPAARSKRTAEIARTGIAELVASGRASPTYTTYVDGRRSDDLESVKPFGGKIVAQFSSIAYAAAFALAFLRGRSPVHDGVYRDSFWVSVNGRIIEWRDFQPKSVPLDAEIIIGNRAPYSRKVDVQMVGKRHLSFSVPPNLFDDAARAVAREYGKAVTAKRVYSIDFPGRYVLRSEQHYLTGRYAGRARGRIGTKVESPALIIAPLG